MTRYQAMLMNHHWTVVDNETHQVTSEHKSRDGAVAAAEKLNLDSWREAKPDTALEAQWGASEADLVEIIDRIFDPETKLDLLQSSLQQVA